MSSSINLKQALFWKRKCKTMLNESGPNVLERALTEAMSLLGGAEFNTHFGDYRQGDLSAVSVMVSPASGNGPTWIHVICHDPGHMGIDWDGIPLVLIDRKTGDERISFLDARGRAKFNVEIPSENELGFMAVSVRSLARVEVPSGIVSGDWAPLNHPAGWNVSGNSPDGSLTAVAEVVGQGFFRIAVRALTEEMRNREVQVILRSKVDPSDVWLSKRIKLDLNDGERGSWSGRVGEEELAGRTSEAMLLVFPCKRK